jgi:hypothetical protein
VSAVHPPPEGFRRIHEGITSQLSITMVGGLGGLVSLPLWQINFIPQQEKKSHRLTIVQVSLYNILHNWSILVFFWGLVQLSFSANKLRVMDTFSKVSLSCNWSWGLLPLLGVNLVPGRPCPLSVLFLSLHSAPSTFSKGF